MSGHINDLFYLTLTRVWSKQVKTNSFTNLFLCRDVEGHMIQYKVKAVSVSRAVIREQNGTVVWPHEAGRYTGDAPRCLKHKNKNAWTVLCIRCCGTTNI